MDCAVEESSQECLSRGVWCIGDDGEAADRRQQVVALGRLGWSLRRIERETGVRRETVSDYLRAAGVSVRGRGRRSDTAAQAAVVSGEVSTDSPPRAWLPAPTRAPQASACEPHRDRIEAALTVGRNAMAIWHDLVDEVGFTARYASVRRFVRQLRGTTVPEARVVIATAPGEEAQVDYGDGPMVRHPPSGTHRRTRLFVLTLAHSRKAVRLLVWQSSAQISAELHERAFRRLGGTPRTATSSPTLASSACRVACAFPIGRARSSPASATRRRRRCTGNASRRSSRRRPISIAGRRTGPIADQWHDQAPGRGDVC
jgi:transposase